MDPRIRLAGCWLDTNPDVLDALAEKIEPGKVLLHLANATTATTRTTLTSRPWTPLAAISQGRAAMGFHVMPHCNAIDMDPTHSIFPIVRDFTYRNLDKTPAGWAWDNGWLPVPTSNKALVENRSRKVMVKIHPGLSMWRSLLTEAIEKGLTGLPTDTVFVDVTANIWNLHNALVENMTCSEGMARLLDLVASIPPGLTVAGEGLNEVIAPGQAFAQAHLFRSHQTSYPGLERTGGTAVGDFLFGALCRTIGYSDLSGGTENSQMRMKVHHSLAAIPTSRT